MNYAFTVKGGPPAAPTERHPSAQGSALGNLPPLTTSPEGAAQPFRPDGADHWRIALKKFAEIFEGMAAFMDSLSDAEVRFMLSCAEQATPTNCDCHTYDAAQFLKVNCELQINIRAFDAAVKQKHSPSAQSAVKKS